MENKTIIFEYIQKLKDKGHSKRFIIKEIMSKYDLQSSTAYLYVLQNGFTNLGEATLTRTVFFSNNDI